MASAPPVTATGADPVAEASAWLDGTTARLATGNLGDAIRAGAILAGVPIRAAEAVRSPAPANVPPVISQAVGELLGAVRTAEDQSRLAVGRSARPAETIDRARLFSASLVMANTIDRTLPLLTADVDVAPARADIQGCDVVNQLPALCIGNTGDNVYTQDAALLIDLGGNDTYRNSAGGASPTENLLAVSVNIDLAGNDVYEAVRPLSSGATVVQGSTVNGIGMLVDVAGDDSYSATHSCETCNATARGQGYAGSGVALLADLAGKDSYLLSAAVNAKETSAVTEGQGYGGLGLGMTLDYGDGADTHVMRTSSCRSCLSTAYGSGYGRVGGVGVSYDDGGTDSYTLEATSAPVSPEDPDSQYPSFLSAQTHGMGYGDDGGAGLHLTGPGDTVRSILSGTTSPRTGGTASLGYGYGDSAGSFGALSDEGGNDSYSLRSSSRAVDHQISEAGCGCGSAKAAAVAAPSFSGGMGATAAGGVALLRDLAGNDVYRAYGESVATARAEDLRTSAPDGKAVTSLAETSTSHVEVHGQSSGGTGLLEDRAGDDVYEATSRSDADALATAVLEGLQTAAEAVSSTAQTFGQGASLFGYGQLRDDAGNDTYRATNESSALADPPTSITTGAAASVVQAMMLGGGPGNALLLDGGGTDTFVSTPAARTPCSGSRGSEMWMDCGAGAAIGINR